MQPDDPQDSPWIAAAAPQALLGVKGPGAAHLLGAHGLQVPSQPNSWEPIDADAASLLLRLGRSEYLLSMQPSDPLLPRLADALSQGSAGARAHAVLREDRCLLIGGARAPQLLAQLCGFDFASVHQSSRTVVLTLLAGVAVTVIEQPAQVYRIWCDPSFAEYLWDACHGVCIADGAQLRGAVPSWAGTLSAAHPSRNGPEHRGSHP